MKARAPGKLLLSGAYAVLEGATAIVAAVDRYAVADASREVALTAPELVAALGDRGPFVDVSALAHEGKKLGLGSSAAGLVAALAALAAARGDELADACVRADLFDAARRAHAQAQAGGSGVDVAASVHGGVLAYTLAGGDARVSPVALPSGLVLEVYFSGASARTTELRARVDALRARSASRHASRMRPLADAAERAARAVGAGDVPSFLDASAAALDGLAALGAEADAPIVSAPFAELARVAREEGAQFLPSGAGGGDVGVAFGRAALSERFRASAARLGMQRLMLGIDRGGITADKP